MPTRKPAVAGTFYPAGRAELDGLVRSYLRPPQEPLRPARGIVVPHAGFFYSGAVAGEVFAGIQPPGRAVLLGPTHRGPATKAAVFSAGAWHTPLGDVLVDSALARKMLEGCPGLTDQWEAHTQEHSLEVQLPFLQVVSPNASIVPVTLAARDHDFLVALGSALGRALSTEQDVPLIIASSDLNHYESHEDTLALDQVAIDAMLALDARRLLADVHNKCVSMCGVAAVAVMLEAAKVLGAKSARLVRHTTSAETSGDFARCVGYAGLIVE